MLKATKLQKKKLKISKRAHSIDGNQDKFGMDLVEVGVVDRGRGLRGRRGEGGGQLASFLGFEAASLSRFFFSIFHFGIAIGFATTPHPPTQWGVGGGQMAPAGVPTPPPAAGVGGADPHTHTHTKIKRKSKKGRNGGGKRKEKKREININVCVCVCVCVCVRSF